MTLGCVMLANWQSSLFQGVCELYNFHKATLLRTCCIYPLIRLREWLCSSSVYIRRRFSHWCSRVNSSWMNNVCWYTVFRVKTMPYAAHTEKSRDCHSINHGESIARIWPGERNMKCPKLIAINLTEQLWEGHTPIKHRQYLHSIRETFFWSPVMPGGEKQQQIRALFKKRFIVRCK